MSSFDLWFNDLARREKEYNARESVSDFDACMQEYEELSDQARSQAAGVFDIQYGKSRAERLDIYLPAGVRHGTPLFVFIHGGYWRALSKEVSAPMVPSLTRAGVAVAVIDYALAPAVSLSEIVRQTRAATTWLLANAHVYGIDPARVHLGGSSAGAHLVASLLQEEWQIDAGPDKRPFGGALCLSGLYDLRPLVDISPNQWLRLAPAVAAEFSPLLHVPGPNTVTPPLILAVGGLETSGFINQTQEFERAWRKNGHSATVVDSDDANHFNLLLELASSDSQLTKALLDQIETRTV